MAASRHRVTFDFGDQPQLLEMLRLLAAKRHTTQKAVLTDALNAYFSQQQEEIALLMAANRTFAEWDNKEDRVYDSGGAVRRKIGKDYLERVVRETDQRQTALARLDEIFRKERIHVGRQRWKRQDLHER